MACIAFLLGSCASNKEHPRPEEQIQDARHVLEAARSARADQFAADSLHEATDAFDVALTEVAAQDHRLVFRSYAKAEKLLTEAKNAALEAERLSRQNREAARLEAEARLEEAEGAIATATTLVHDAPNETLGPQQFISSRETLIDLSHVLEEAKKQCQRGEFLAATSRAASVTSAANEIARGLKGTP